MAIKRVAHRKQMAKNSAKKQVVGGTASTLTDAYLAKAKEEGFLAASTEVVFPSIGVIPHPSLASG
jgi:hypothetical protein